jgi:hypothetical protein
MNTTKNREWTLVLRKGKQFLFHQWPPSCYISYKLNDKPWMRKVTGSACDKWNITVVIYETDIPYRLSMS